MERLSVFIKSVISAHLIFLLLAVSPCVASSSFSQQEAKGTKELIAERRELAELPDTALGRIMREWFAVIQSGKDEEIKTFVEEHLSSNAFRQQHSAAEYVTIFRKLHEQSGGLEIVQVSPQSLDQPISILARSRRGAHFARIQAGLDGAEKGKLVGIGVDKAADPAAPKLSDISGPLAEEEMTAAIKSDLDRRATAGDFSGVVLIARGDKILLRRAYGYADHEAKIPNTVDTKFHLASVGKMFTAIAIAQLVRAGKLSFTDTIAEVLPDYPNKEVAGKVTLHQLLTHTAGFGTFFESPGFVPGKTYRNSTEEIAVYKDEKLFSVPGTRWRYSNAGYSLLGAIIERVSGKPYLQYVRENIFSPLGMRDTYTATNGKPAAKSSVFYTQSELDPLGLEPYVANRKLGGGQATGFGGGFSTASDMFKFLRALRTGKLLGGELTDNVVKGKFNLDEKGTRRWAYGMSESVINGETVRGHQGGSRADVQILWESGYTVIVLSNAIPPTVNVVSNDVVAFITRQRVMRGKSVAGAQATER